MELGLILVVIGVIIAFVAAFLPNYSVRMLAAAVILIGIGVLLGVGGGINVK